MNLEEFRHLDLAEIGQWPRAAKLIVWGVLALFIWMLGYRILVAPSLDSLAAARRQEPLLKQEFEQKTAIAARLNAHHQGDTQVGQDVDDGMGTLPEESEVAGLLEDITHLGKDNGLSLQYFKPEPELHKGLYAEMPIRIGLNGNYHQLGRFISDLAGLPRIVTVDTIHISRLDKNSKGLKMEMVVRTYHAENPKDKHGAPAGKDGGR